MPLRDRDRAKLRSCQIEIMKMKFRCRSNSPRRVAVLILMVNFGAACGPLPQPFAHHGDGGLRVAPSSGAVVVVAGIENGGHCEAALMAAVVEALQRAEIPATTGTGNRASPRLEGRLGGYPGVKDDLTLRWALTKSDGAVIGHFHQRLAAEYPCAAAPMAVVAEKTARGVAELLIPSEVSGNQRPPMTVAIAPVVGAPGDGAETLGGGMAEALSAAGVVVAAGDEETETPLVLGSVAMDIDSPGFQRVEIVWQVIYPSGEELGVVRQANTVSMGSLDGPWGPIAQAVARVGVPGILELLGSQGR